MYIPAQQTAVFLDINYLFELDNGRLIMTKSLKYKLCTVKCCNVLLTLLRQGMKVKGLKNYRQHAFPTCEQFASCLGKLNISKMKC